MAKKEAEIKMRVRIGESELEVTGPKKYVEDKIAEFLKLQKTSVRQPQAAGVPATTKHLAKGTKGLSVGQFFKKLALKSDVDRVLGAGYFLEKHKNEENFNASEITKTIKSAKNPPPSNTNATIDKNIKKGYMMAAGEKDKKNAFVLTTDGEAAIEALLDEK